VRVLKLGDLVFDSQLLPLQVGDEIEIGEGSVRFLIDGLLQVAMFGLERLNAIF